MAATSSARTPVLRPGAYRIDPQRSTVAYTGKHLFGTGTVRATFAVRSGELVVGDPLTASTAAVSVDAASFTSDKARRDRDVRAAGLLDVATYPDITFVASGARQDGDRWTFSGTVTAHGTEVPVDVVVEDVQPEGDGLRVKARAEHLDRHAFGITGSRGMVGRHLDLDLDVFAAPADR